MAIRNSVGEVCLYVIVLYNKLPVHRDKVKGIARTFIPVWCKVRLQQRIVHVCGQREYGVRPDVMGVSGNACVQTR
ncbi:MAG TPA: hypothetical protein PKA53_02045 [Sphingobacterium sp.]|nr:hypothetical protein [Sphingobacterium sp.]